MFLGHFAVGFAAKRAAPRAPVTALLFAAMFLDVLWPIFLWLGIEHRADLPLFPWGGPEVGLGLWNSVPATAGTEIAMLVVGLLLYLSATRARGWTGHLSLWSLVALVAFFYVGTVRGDVPPSVAAIKLMMTLLILVMLAWFGWIDRTREPRAPRQELA